QLLRARHVLNRSACTRLHAWWVWTVGHRADALRVSLPRSPCFMARAAVDDCVLPHQRRTLLDALFERGTRWTRSTERGLCNHLRHCAFAGVLRATVNQNVHEVA